MRNIRPLLIDYGHGGLCKRNHDTPDNLPLVSPVHLGGLPHAGRNAGKGRPHDYKVKGVYRRRQNNSQSVVFEPEAHDHKVKGNQAAMEVHGEDYHPGDGFVPVEPFSRKHVRPDNGKYHAKRGSGRYIEYRIEKTRKNIRILQNELISL